MFSFNKTILALVLVYGLSACRLAHYPAAPDMLPIQSQAYTLQQGDVVHIETYGEKDLSGDFEIDAAGRITLPLIGPQPVAGMNEAAAALVIADTLQKQHYMALPHVALAVRQYAPFSIMGEVEKGGQYPYRPGLTIYQAVAIAGGYTYRADRSDLVVSRRDPKLLGKETRLSGQEITPLLPGDVIEVGERFF